MDLGGLYRPKWSTTPAVANDLSVIPGHELDKVAMGSNASPTIKGRLDVAFKVLGGNWSLYKPRMPSRGPPMPLYHFLLYVYLYLLLRQGFPR